MNNMIKLDCQWLQQQTFSNCTQVKTVSGEDAICVQTYNRWSDDSLLTFYIIQCGNKLLITDEAESIFHFRTVGLLENKRNWRGIQEKLNGTKTDIQFAILIGLRQQLLILFLHFVQLCIMKGSCLRYLQKQ